MNVTICDPAGLIGAVTLTQEEANDLARDMVGDDQSPNVFFVTFQGMVRYIYTEFESAYACWRNLTTAEETALEDRQYGVICCTEPDEETDVLVTHDDSHMFKE